jgi:hypothetical protein
MRGFSKKLKPLSNIGVTLLAIFALVLQPAYGLMMTGIANALDQPTTLAERIAAASPGDTIDITSDEVIPSEIIVNKPLTIKSTNGSTLSTTTPMAGMLGLQADNITIEGITFKSNFNIGDSFVVRGLEVSTHSGIVIKNNKFLNLRQPAYINDNVQAVVEGNYTDQTKGWVVVANSNVMFTGNTWGTNVTDIAIIDNDGNAATPVINNYPCSVVATIKANNNNASVDDQVVIRHCVTPPAEQTVTVRPSNLQGWAAVDDNGNGGNLSFVSGPGAAPVGSGSAQLQVSAANQGYILAKAGAYGGTKLADIATIDYSTYTTTGNNLWAPSVQLNITPDVSGVAAWYGRLVYEPYMNSATVTDGQWNTWNAAEGKWWLSKPSSFGGHCAQDTPCTFEELIGFYPNIGINTGVYAGVGLKAGSSWTTYTGSVDNFHFASAANNDRYDFEQNIPLAAPTNLTPANNTYTNNPDFSMTWSTVEGAAGYQYRTSNTMNGSDLGPIIYCDGSVAASDGCNGAAYHLVPGNFTTTDSTVTRGNSGTPEGDYYWQVRAIDADGNPGSWSVINKVTVDTTAPGVPTLQTPANGALINYNTFWFNWSDVTGAVSYEFQASQSSATDLQGSLTSGVWHGDASGNEPVDSQAWSSGASGTWYWQVRAVDAAGNKGAWTTPWSVTIDMTAPAVPSVMLTDNNGASVANGGYITTQYFTFHLPDGVARYQLKYWNDITGSAFKGEANAWNPTNLSGYMPTSTTYRDNFTQGEGVHYFAFSACDAAGNCSAYSAPFAVTYDKTAPAAPANLAWTTSTGESIVNGGLTNEESGVASWEASASSDVDHYIYRYWNDISGNPYKVGSEYVVPSVSGTSLPGVFNQGEGVHYFSVAAVDHAGNVSAFSTPFKITYDTTAKTENPTDTSTTSGGNGNVLGATTTNGSSSSNGTGSTTGTDETSNGTENTAATTGEVLAAEDTKAATTGTSDDSSSNTKKDDSATVGTILGLKWYWWLVILVAVAALWWFIAALRRRTDKEA